MSGRLITRILDSALPAWLKPFAVALASFALDDGSRAYPSAGRLARMTGKSERQARRALRALRRAGVITPVGRQRKAVEYQIHTSALPQAGDADQLGLFPQVKSDARPRGGAGVFHSLHRRKHDAGVTPPLTSVSPDPLSDPLFKSHQYARARKVE